MAFCHENQIELKRLVVGVQKKHQPSKFRRKASSFWFGCFRLLGCFINIGMILGMYLEYLWAADWEPIPAHCENRGKLPWLDFANCFHRYTFSHAMLRGQNLQVFAVFGAFVAVCFVVTERRRVQDLHLMMHDRLQQISVDGIDNDGIVPAIQSTLNLLPIYKMLVFTAFIGVLGLVPFHLERPLLHYGCAGCVAGGMLSGVCTYMALPLDLAAGLKSSGGGAAIAKPTKADGDLVRWAQRHQSLRQWSWLVVALHFILPVTVLVHHLAWMDATGRIFGACEVLTILSYQFFVAVLAIDDFSTQIDTQPSSTSDEIIDAKPLLASADAAKHIDG
jgi:hypothetical protein